MTTWLFLWTSVLKYSAGKLVCSVGSYKGKLILRGFSSGKEVILHGMLFLCICPASLQGFWGYACRYADLRGHVWVYSPPAKKRGTGGCRCPLCSQHSLWCKAVLSAMSPCQLFPFAVLSHTGYGSTRCLPRVSAEMPMLSVSQSCMGMTDSATSTPKYLDEWL